MPDKSDPLKAREVIFEFMTLGEWVQVRAIDVKTGLEVSASAPAATAQHDLQRLGAGKLARVLGLQRDEVPSFQSPEPTPAKPKRGFIA